MSAATLSGSTVETASPEHELSRPVRLQPARVRPAGRPGRSSAPRSRPARPLAAPSLNPTSLNPTSLNPTALNPMVQRGVRSCLGEAAPGATASWPVHTPVRVRTRITDRGIALVLVAGVMIVLAAVTVVGLTALRVTSDSYQPLAAAYAAQP